MTPVEILSVIFAILILIRALLLLVSPKIALKRAEFFLNKPALLMVIYIIFIVVIGYFVISALGIVNTFAALVLGASLIGLILVIDPKAAMKFSKAMVKNRKKLLSVMVIWVVLAIWVLYAVFG